MEISQAEFTFYMQQLGPFKSGSALAVALSGGPDSLCLVLLLDQWSQQHNHKVTALIVDHQLRPESAAEAQYTALQLSQLGIKAVILTWQNDKPFTRIQEIARQKRYDLMLNWCRQYNHAYLLTGHHLQDQHETALWRLWRGSDVWGLAGISAQINRHNITICRPLLQLSKTRIEATLQPTFLQPIRDPSNHNQKFARVAIRNKLLQLPVLPLNALGRLRESFEKWRENFIKLHVVISPYGYLTINFDCFKKLSSPFQQFLISHLITVIGHQSYPIGRDKLAKTIRTILSSPNQICTQGGCILYVRQHTLFIIREWINTQILPIINADLLQTLTWDGRFKLYIGDQIGLVDLEIRCMGEMGWMQVCQAHQTSLLIAIPYHARLALPTLWYQNHMISICHFPNILSDNQLLIRPIFNPATLLLPLPFKTLMVWQ